MGIVISFTIITLWLGHLFFILSSVHADFSSLQTYLHLLFQTYLFTGLFITAHDAMHGTICKTKSANKFFGIITSFFYAGMSYNRLIKNHFKHHKSPGTESDPDFNAASQNFFIWWGTFLIRYATVVQIIVMAAAFNILKIWFEEISIWIYWVVPALLSSMQLFYFGTYIPHRKPHEASMEPHKARSQKKNHLWAMISCYFFGYHYEHHEKPFVPWWKLYSVK